LQLGACHVGAEAMAFVALAVRRSVESRSGVGLVVATFVVAAIIDSGQRNLTGFAIQTMARPMAAPAGDGLRQHETDHQFGNQCLHNAPRFYLIITVIGSPDNAACGKIRRSAVREAFLTPIIDEFPGLTRFRNSANRTGQNDCRQSFWPIEF
jgi:hypothetical protein